MEDGDINTGAEGRAGGGGVTDTCVTPSTCVRTGGRGREGEGSRMTNLPPLTLQELRVPTNGVSPVRLERYDHSPYRGREWRDQAEDFNHHNNGIYALQEKINLLKNHPSEIFNFMVVSGSPRLGKNYQYYAIHSTPLHSTCLQSSGGCLL